MSIASEARLRLLEARVARLEARMGEARPVPPAATEPLAANANRRNPRKSGKRR